MIGKRSYQALIFDALTRLKQESKIKEEDMTRIAVMISEVAFKEAEWSYRPLKKEDLKGIEYVLMYNDQMPDKWLYIKYQNAYELKDTIEEWYSKTACGEVGTSRITVNPDA